MRPIFLLFGLIAVSQAVGCFSQADPLKRQKITGTITLDGNPLAEGTIRFDPQSGPTASGAMIADGKYTIPANMGLAPGSYRVFISAMKPGGPTLTDEEAMQGLTPMLKEWIPPKYNTKSDVTIDVTEDGENQFDFSISSK